jgi:two-component system OmpR family sensor kinase
MSLRARLLLSLIPLFVLGLIAADAGTYTALRSSFVSSVDTQLHNSRASVEFLLEGGGPFDNGPGGRDGGGGPAGGPGQFPQYTYGALYDTSGKLIASRSFVFNASAAPSHPNLPAQLPPGEYMDVNGSGAISTYRVYAGPAVDGSGNLLVVGIPLDSVNATLNNLLVLEASISGGVVILMLIAGWILVRRGLRPLERMATTARSIAASDLSKRVEPSNDATEVGRLGLALNTMLEQLQAAFQERERNEERLRHFISDASHELRTPLTSMQGYAELLQRAPALDHDDMTLALRRMEAETKRMGVLVDDLLLLARLDQGRPLEREPVDLEALVHDACTDARAADPIRRITTAAAAPLVVTGDAMRLRQVLANLVRNALVHTPPGTPVEISLHADGADAVIDVVDHGRGIPETQRAQIFERFHRADPERSGDRGGSGLGLSIAAAVVTAHGGRIGVTQTAGGGATFTVRLPAAASRANDAPEPADPASVGR